MSKRGQTTEEQEQKPTFEIMKALFGTFGHGKKKGVSDQEIIKRLRQSGETLREYYKGDRDALDKLGQGRFLNSFLSAKRQLEILERIVVDARGAEKWRKVRQEQEKPKEIQRLNEAQWATTATTPNLVLEYASMEEAQAKGDELEKILQKN